MGNRWRLRRQRERNPFRRAPTPPEATEHQLIPTFYVIFMMVMANFLCVAPFLYKKVQQALDLMNQYARDEIDMEDEFFGRDDQCRE